MIRFRNIFRHNICNIIGMIHVSALPGTPGYSNSLHKMIEDACTETEIYSRYGVDGIIIENMNDIPYIKSAAFEPEVTAIMTRLATEVRKILPPQIPCGVQVLAGGNKEAVAVAQAADLQFIRAEGFVFGHIGDEGYFDSCAGSLLRYRRRIDAENILVFTDIKKKHSSHAITNDVNIADTAKAAEFFMSDGVVLTGAATGDATNIEEVGIVMNNIHIPVLIGSGVTIENLPRYKKANGLIIGSYFKHNGRWTNPVDKERVRRFMEVVNNLRENE